MDRETVSVYEEGAAAYRDRRRAYHPERAEAFARSLPDGSLRLDLGCGPGHYLPHLGEPVLASDAAEAMVRLAVAAEVPGTKRPLGVVSDLEALPFRRGGLGGVWASKCLQHVPAERLPMALAGLHHAVAVGGVADITLFAGDGEQVSGSDFDDTDFPGRLFTWWRTDDLERLLVGAGFTVELVETDGEAQNARIAMTARRARSLPDTVGPGMQLLMCGLNPSLYAADAGVGFARPGNRFWPAMQAAGLVDVDRDPTKALFDHGIGMTDLVKRATVAAAELTKAEYREGLRRVEHLVDWLRPRAICFVGLAGWRAAVDPRAQPGVQPHSLAGTPVYVMPSTSGLNAHSRLPDLTAHLRAAAELDVVTGA